MGFLRFCRYNVAELELRRYPFTTRLFIPCTALIFLANSFVMADWPARLTGTKQFVVFERPMNKCFDASGQWMTRID
jgi:hypothetical protein